MMTPGTLTAPPCEPPATAATATDPAAPVLARHRGRAVTQTDIDSIRALIAAHPGASRRRQQNGRLSADWQRRYGHPIHYLETFTDPALFAGTCYRAANWTPLGLTTGRGKAAMTKKANRSLKLVWGLPLTPRWRQRLQGGA